MTAKQQHLYANAERLWYGNYLKQHPSWMSNNDLITSIHYNTEASIHLAMPFAVGKYNECEHITHYIIHGRTDIGRGVTTFQLRHFWIDLRCAS